VSGDITRHPSEIEDNFSQAGIFFRNVLSDPEKERLVDNMGSHLANAQKFIQVTNLPELFLANYLEKDFRILMTKFVYTTYFVLQ
jgi:catalase